MLFYIVFRKAISTAVVEFYLECISEKVIENKTRFVIQILKQRSSNHKQLQLFLSISYFSLVSIYASYQGSIEFLS